MVGKNNHTKDIQANLKEHYKAYKVGKHWVYASLASLSLGAALFFGSNSVTYADTTTEATSATTNTDVSPNAALQAKAVTLSTGASHSENTDSTDSTDSTAEASTANVASTTDSSTPTEATSDQNTDNTAATAQTTSATPAAANPTDATQTTAASDSSTGTENDSAKLATAESENVTTTSGTEATSTANSDDAKTTSATADDKNTVSDTLTEAVTTANEADQDSQQTNATTDSTATETAKSAESTAATPDLSDSDTTTTKTDASKTDDTAATSETAADANAATTAKTLSATDEAKVEALQAQLKTLLVNPTEADLTEAKTVASALYALTGEPQTIAAVADEATSPITLTSDLTTIGAGVKGDTMTVTAKISAQAGDTVSITLPTDFDSLDYGSVEQLPEGTGTTTMTNTGTNGTTTITNVFTQSGIFEQKITLKLLNNNADVTLTKNQVGKSVKQITATVNNVAAPEATINITQMIQPTLKIASFTRVRPDSTITAVVPDTDYVYNLKVIDSSGLKDVSGDGIDKKLNLSGTTITVPTPTSFTLNSDLTNQINGFTDGTTITQDATSGDVIITVPAGISTGKKGFYISGSYSSAMTDTAQTLTATQQIEAQQEIVNGSILLGDGPTWAETMLASGDADAPAKGSVDISGNSSSARDKLVLDNDDSNNPEKLVSYGFSVNSASAITDAQITLDVPDGIDATGVIVPESDVNTSTYLPGTTSYNYTLTLEDGTEETGIVAAGGTVTKQSTTARVTKITLNPDYLAAGASTGGNSISLLGAIASTKIDGTPVVTDDQMVFTTAIALPSESNETVSKQQVQTVVEPVARAHFYTYEASTEPGATGSYMAIQFNGVAGQTTDQIFEPILYFVLPKSSYVTDIRDKSGAAVVTTYTTDTGQTGVKMDYTGTGAFVDTSISTGSFGLSIANYADALPGDYDTYMYITSPTTKLGQTTLVTDTSMTDGDANAVETAEYAKVWKISSAKATLAKSMAEGNEDTSAVKDGQSNARGDDDLTFYTSIINTTDGIANSSVAINLPTQGDDQGSTYTFNLNGPVEVPTNYTTVDGTGDAMNATVLYSTERYDSTASTALDTTGYVTADQITDWSTVRSVIVEAGDLGNNTSTGRIKITGTTDNFIEQSNTTGYLQTSMYANSSPVSVTDKASSISISSTSTVGAQMHYVDDNGVDQYINLSDLTKTLTDNKDTLKAKDFPDTTDFTNHADDLTLIPENYHLLTNADGKLTTTIVNSDVADYGADEPNNAAVLDTVSKYDYDGDMVQYELIKDEPASTTPIYVDDDAVDPTNNVVKTDAPITGLVGDHTSYTIDMGDLTDQGYVLVDGQDNPINYQLSTDDATNPDDTTKTTNNIVVHVKHGTGTVTTGTSDRDNTDLQSTVTRTINYVYSDNAVADKAGTEAAPSVTQTQDYTRSATIDKVTKAVISYTDWTPASGNNEGLSEVDTQPIEGYQADKTTIAAITAAAATPEASGTQTLTETVTYKPEAQNVIVQYIDVNASDKTSGWTASDGTLVGSSTQKFDGLSEFNYTNTIKFPSNYTQVGADDGATNGVFDAATDDDQVYNVYLKHLTKTLEPQDDPTNTNLNANITRTIDYVYSADSIHAGQTAAPSVIQNQSFTRVGTQDLVTNDITYGEWTASTGAGQGLTTQASPDTVVGYTPDQTSVDAIATDTLSPSTVPGTVTVTYMPDNQKVIVHYIDVNGSDKTAGFTNADGTEIANSTETVNGNSENTYTNTVEIPTNYKVVEIDAGATSGTFDNDDKVDQSYNVYFKHETQEVNTTTDPSDVNLKSAVSRTINYVYGEKSDKANQKSAETVTQTQDFTRTGTKDLVTGNIDYHDDWTAVTGADEGLNEVTTVPITGYTPSQDTVTAVAASDLTPGTDLADTTVTYNPDGQKVIVHYIDVNGSDKTAGFTNADGTEIANSTETVNGNSENTYTNTVEIPTNYKVVEIDAGATSGTFDNDDKVDQSYNVYFRHETQEVNTTTDPSDVNLKSAVSRTINYVYGKNSDKADQKAAETVTQTQDFTRTETKDLVTGNIDYHDDWTAVTGADEGLNEVTTVPITGYTPSQDTVTAVAASDLTPGTDLTDTTVTYNPDDQKVTVHYIDVNGSDKTTGWTATDGIEIVDSAQIIPGYSDNNYSNKIVIPKNYLQIVADTGSSAGIFDSADKDAQDYYVYLKHGTVAIDLTSNPDLESLKTSISRTIQYVYGDNTTKAGQTAAPTVIQTQNFTRTATGDAVDGTILSYGDWQAITTGDEGFTEVKSPDNISGYTADQPTVAAIGATDVQATDAPREVTVKYNADKQQAKVTYVDDATGTDLSAYDETLTGVTDESGQYQVTIPDGYILSTNQGSNVPYKFTTDDKDDLIIHLNHKITDGTITTTRTINYFIQGTQTPLHDTTIQTITWKTVTDEVTGTSYATPQNIYPEVDGPAVPGYRLVEPGKVNNQYLVPMAVEDVPMYMTETIYYTAIPVAPVDNDDPDEWPEVPDTNLFPNQPSDEDTTPEVPKDQNDTTTDGKTEIIETPTSPSEGQTITDSATNPQTNELNELVTGTSERVNNNTASNAQLITTSNDVTNAADETVRSADKKTQLNGQPAAKNTNLSTGNAETLPQTGEHTNRVWTMLGLSLVSVIGLLGLAKRKKRFEEK